MKDVEEAAQMYNAARVHGKDPTEHIAEHMPPEKLRTLSAGLNILKGYVEGASRIQREQKLKEYRDKKIQTEQKLSDANKET